MRNPVVALYADALLSRLLHGVPRQHEGTQPDQMPAQRTLQQESVSRIGPCSCCIAQSIVSELTPNARMVCGLLGSSGA